MLYLDSLGYFSSTFSVVAFSCLTFLVVNEIGKLLIPHLSELRRSKALTKEIDGPKPHWLFGHLHLLKPNQESILKTCEQTKLYPKMGMAWIGPVIPYLMLIHPHVIRPLLTVEEPKDNLAYRFIKPWIGDGLLVSHGKKWRRNRHLLTKAFHFDILKQYSKVFESCCNTMLDKWTDKCDGNMVEVSSPISRMTLDSMMQCAISCETDCQLEGKSNEYTSAVYTLTTIAMKRIFNPFCHIDWIFGITKSGRQFKEAAKYIHDFDEKVICERQFSNRSVLLQHLAKDDKSDSEKIAAHRKSEGKHLDFLDILLLTRDEDGKGLTEREIRDEVDTFLFEGHDTTASGIAWSFYCLATNTEHQETCRREIKEVLGTKTSLNWQDLSKLPFVTMFIKEVLRLYPPVFAIARRTKHAIHFPRGFGADQHCMEDVPVDTKDKCGRKVEAPCNMAIPIMNVHRNEQLWDDPQVFNPWRFSAENCSKRSPYAYIPFSAGPRNCIGQNFAMAELKTVIAQTLLRYKLYVDDECPTPVMSPMIVLKSTNGIHIKLEKI